MVLFPLSGTWIDKFLPGNRPANLPVVLPEMETVVSMADGSRQLQYLLCSFLALCFLCILYSFLLKGAANAQGL